MIRRLINQVILILLWCIMFAGTTQFLLLSFLLSLVKKNRNTPYFASRSIYYDPASETQTNTGGECAYR